jgi:para-aminobenzoate synthetase component 1
VRRIDGTPPPEVCLSRIRAHEGLVLLHSASGEPRRFSLLAFDPLRDSHGEPATPRQSLEGLREFRARLTPVAGDALPAHFAGGVLAALSYDLGVQGAALDLPRDSRTAPLVVAGLYTDFIVFDHERDVTWLVLGEDPGDGRASVREREDHLIAELERQRVDAAVTPLGPLVREVDGAVHRARVSAVRERIAAGEIYQANLAHAFHRDLAGDPVDIYLQLLRVNPAPYMAYLAWRDGAERGAILSASPELLLEFDGRTARTRPIKGTSARHADPALDAAAARDLLASPKDRAELAMIVDLERNDLGRVAVPRSVRVDGFPTLSSYASVHHLSADVSAQVRPGLDAADVLAACFPGGSITGAPKLASMEAIAELEGAGRGFFSGSLGFWDLADRACFNILIRTLCWTPNEAPGTGRVRYHVGGGITWGSDPEAEECETMVKGERLARALDAAPQVVGDPAC